MPLASKSPTGERLVFVLNLGGLWRFTGVPSPVTASQPLAAGNPSVPQPMAEPLVMSLRPKKPLLYRNGFRKPSGLLPSAIRASFTKEMTDANAGEDALVPSRGLQRISHAQQDQVQVTYASLPFQTVAYARPCAATSGYARPLGLYKPANLSPRDAAYISTATSWYNGR
jgi:hypothetical protein